MKIPHAVWGSGGIKFGRILAVAAFFFAIPIAASAGESVTLAWLPSPSPNAIGYKLYYGLSTGSYTTTVDVGNVTSNVVSALATGATYYFSATAYDATGNESPHCTEISYRTPSALSVTWANPADIVYGTPLGPQQLNATATVAGTFVYNPPPGTVLSAGTGQKLTAIFVPDDQVTYGPVTNSAQINVQRAPLQVVADNKSNVYGASLPTLTATWTGFVNGDTVASLTTPIILGTPATLSSGVGSYAITASGAASPNYTIGFTGNALSITPATLTIAADNKTRAQNTTNPVFTATYSGWANGDTVATLSSPVTFATTAIQSSPPGSYPITVTSGTNPNYTIRYVNGTLTVTGRQLVSIALSPLSMALSAGQTSQLTATGTYSDGTKQNLTTTVSWSSANTTVATVKSTGLVTAKNSGSATIRASSGGLTGSASVTVVKAVGRHSLPDASPLTLQIAPDPEGHSGAMVTLSGTAGTRCELQVTTDLVHWETSLARVLGRHPYLV